MPPRPRLLVSCTVLAGLLAGTSFAVAGTVSPDGQTATLLSSKGGELVVLDLATRKALQTYSGQLVADGHQWVVQGNSQDYLEKAFGGFTRSYPSQGGDALPTCPAVSCGRTPSGTARPSGTTASTSAAWARG